MLIPFTQSCDQLQTSTGLRAGSVSRKTLACRDVPTIAPFWFYAIYISSAVFASAAGAAGESLAHVLLKQSAVDFKSWQVIGKRVFSIHYSPFQVTQRAGAREHELVFNLDPLVHVQSIFSLLF